MVIEFVPGKNFLDNFYHSVICKGKVFLSRYNYFRFIGGEGQVEETEEIWLTSAVSSIPGLESGVKVAASV